MRDYGHAYVPNSMGVRIVNPNGTNYMALSQSMAYISYDSTPPYGWGVRPLPYTPPRPQPLLLTFVKLS